MERAWIDIRRDMGMLNNSVKVPPNQSISEDHCVKSLLYAKNVPAAIYTLIRPYLGVVSDRELRRVMREYKRMEEMRKIHVRFSGRYYITVISILRNIILLALDRGHVDMFEYLMKNTAAAWESVWKVETDQFVSFRSGCDSSQFAPMLARLVCYRGKDGDSRWMGIGLRSHVSWFTRVSYSVMGSGSNQQILSEIAKVHHIVWDYGVLLKAALSGDRNPDTIVLLADRVDWIRTIRVFFTAGSGSIWLSADSIESLCEDIASIKAAERGWSPDSLAFLTEIAAWQPVQIKFLEKGLSRSIKCEDLDPDAMAFLEELFS